MLRTHTHIILALLTFTLISLSGCGAGSGSSGNKTSLTTPTVSFTNPVNNSTGFSINVAITATFSTNMDATTITTSTFTLSNGVTGVVTYSGTTATFTPSSNLTPSTTYIATITTAVRDTAGVPLASNYSWSFTTGVLVQQGGALQGNPLSLVPIASTFAGTAPDANGLGDTARFYAPIATVSYGDNLYVADTYNNKIRKIVISTGVVTTLAGTGVEGAADGAGATATFFFPNSITTDGINLYVADINNNKVRKIDIATGVVSSLTGVANTASSYGAADGAGATATFHFIGGITTDGPNLYVMDTFNNKVRKIDIATGVVSSLTGVANTASSYGAADGAGSTATFGNPFGITITTDGLNLYVMDTYNNKVRKIVIATGVVSSLTGVANTASSYGAADGAGSTATFNFSKGITTDGINLYIADTTNHKVRKIVISTKVVSSLTGVENTASSLGAADSSGSTATFFYPHGITSDGTNLYVADTNNNKIRKIVIATGVVSSLAGVSPGTDGTHSAASFFGASDVTTDGTNLYVADTDNNKIRKVVIATGVVTTLAGTGVSGASDGAGLTATFSTPTGITTDGINLFIADRNNNKIRKIVIDTGVVTTLAGTGSYGAADGAGATATLNFPSGITSDGTNLYVADTWNHKIRKIAIATGNVSSVTGIASTVSTSGAVDGSASTASFYYPDGITSNGTNLYVADTWNHKIRKIVIANGNVSSVTGIANTASLAGAADGAGTTASFNKPTGITSDGTNLYVGDINNYKIRQIVISSMVVSSVTGTANTAGTKGSTDGAGSATRFYAPAGVTTDGSKLFVADGFVIRQVQ